MKPVSERKTTVSPDRPDMSQIAAERDKEWQSNRSSAAVATAEL